MNPNENIRVLNIFGQLNRGGAELRTIQALPWAKAENVRVDFCALSGKAGELDPEVETAGGRVYPIRLDWRFPVRFRNLLRTNRYDVVHSHVHFASGLILALAALCGVPNRICHFRSSADGRRPGAWTKFRNWSLKSLIDLSATRILAVSENALQAAWRPDWESDDRCRVLYNGVDVGELDARRVAGHRATIRARYGIGGRDRLIVHVGRFGSPKNQEFLVEVLAAMATDHEPISMILVGRHSESQLNSVRTLAAKRGVLDRLVIAGEQPCPGRYLDAADLMIFPSLWEGMPGAVLEALSRGLPVLASDLPCIREIEASVPGLQTLALERGHTTWASIAENLLSLKDDRPKSGTSFIPCGSDFDINISNNRLVDEWKRSPGGLRTPRAPNG